MSQIKKFNLTFEQIDLNRREEKKKVPLVYFKSEFAILNQIQFDNARSMFYRNRYYNVYVSFCPSIASKDMETRGKMNSVVGTLVIRCRCSASWCDLDLTLP